MFYHSEGLLCPFITFHNPSLLPFPSLFIAIPKCLHSYCHEDASRLSSLWQSLCLYLTEQSHIASVCLKHGFRWHDAMLNMVWVGIWMIWRVVKGYEGLEKPFIRLNYRYTMCYDQFMKGEGLTCVSFEAGRKRMTQRIIGTGTLLHSFWRWACPCDVLISDIKQICFGCKVK